ncbi:sensor histidine kinase [Parvibium lacunae]|uniref:Histidine kinase n=1 Tax=Parvibium lacunae TaxID=1888893 RepID=A0A368L4B8_9BURK|nr:histidine kinase [Parvibium lacunae]RCS58365.1 histidine kinase [Parvibium lacunae]
MQLNQIIKQPLRLLRFPVTPQQHDVYAPDWCSLGVVIRVLLCVNGLAFLACLWPWFGFDSSVAQYTQLAVWLQPVTFLSLVCLCLVRRLVPANVWLQRWAAFAVPASLAIGCGFLIESLLWLNEAPALLHAWRGLSAALMGLALQHYFELRARAFSPAIAEARLQALQARIRPHFLFNSLNAVLGIIRTDPRRAEATLEDLADLFRELMRERHDLLPLATEISLCQRYLAVEQLRLGTRLQVQWRLPDSTALSPDIMIPSLLLQPLLENAVHHGIEPAIDGGMILIQIHHHERRLSIEITNPYHADHTSKGNHLALDNIRARLALLYDVEAVLNTTIVESPAGGDPSGRQFQVRLTFPVRHIPRKPAQHGA